MVNKSPNTVVAELEELLLSPERLVYQMIGCGTVYQDAVNCLFKHFHDTSFEEFFSSAWGTHIAEKVRAMDATQHPSLTTADARHYAETAFMVVSSVGYVQFWDAMEINAKDLFIPPGFPPKPMPASSFGKDLGFEASKMGGLQRALLIVPSEQAARKLLRQKTVSDYVDVAYQESSRIKALGEELAALSD